MARIPRAVIDEVRNSVDIVDVIGRYVQLKKAGKNFTGLCPFHNEQTPSFSVNAEKQYYHCFGCGRSGNVFQFLMDYQHINFVEAVAAVAKDAGISLPEQYVQSSNHPAAPVDSETGQLIQLHQKAAELYHYILVGTPAGEAGLHYLTRRGVSRELIDQFQLGFAPEQQVLKAYCDKGKLDYQLLRKSGLFTEDREGQLHDRFANRVMYPIKNRRGQVIAFSGRLLSTVNTDLPKYLNSPETPIFNKRRTLFNLDVARKAARQDGKLYLFEGFMDVISAFGAGVQGGVASMGTSFTEEQVGTIHRTTTQLDICYDGDSAGQNAIDRAIKLVESQQTGNLQVRVVQLPAGIDPDEYVQRFGPEKFNAQATQVLFDGFLKIYMEGTDNQESEEDEVMLPDLQTGTRMTDKGILAECKFTAAPQRYSEATLVKKLEELGIGRPSTYAPTIATLTTGRGYIVKGDKDGKKVVVNDLELKDGTVKDVTRTESIGAERGKLLPQEIGMIVTDYLEKYFTDIVDYDFTANVEKDFDQIAGGNLVWNEVIAGFYSPFHKKVEEVLNDGNYSHVSKDLGTDGDGNRFVAKFGKFGPFIQKGEGENVQYASLGKGQLIEDLTLEDALKLFQLPRTVGKYKDVDVVALKGRFGPFIKYGDKNFSIPRGKDPLTITLEECSGIIEEGLNKSAANPVMAEYKDSDIQVINGRYGPYIKHAGSNYKIPKGTDAARLTEEACLEIINNSKPTEKGRRRYKKS